MGGREGQRPPERHVICMRMATGNHRLIRRHGDWGGGLVFRSYVGLASANINNFGGIIVGERTFDVVVLAKL